MSSEASEHKQVAVNEEEVRDVELATTSVNEVVVDAIKDEVLDFVDNNFDLIKSEVLKELDDLATDFQLLAIVKIIIELVEKEGRTIKLKGSKKKEAVVEICVRLGMELNKLNNDESELIGSILVNRKSIEKQVDIIMKIHHGELQINLEDGLDDEIEIVVACCGGCLNPLLSYLSKKCKCITAKKKSK